MFAQRAAKIAFPLATLLPIGSLGCFSTLVVSNYQKGPVKSHQETLSDTILALGLPDEGLKRELGHEDALYVMGEARSYLLLQGAGEIIKVSKALQGERVVIHSRDESLFFLDGRIWGNLEIRCINNAPSQEFIARLASLGFVQARYEPTVFEKSIPVKGVVQKSIPLPGACGDLSKLSAKQEIHFFAPPKSAVVPNIKTTAVLPFAVAADVVTSPVQVLGVLFLLKAERP